MSSLETETEEASLKLIIETKVEVYTERRGRKGSARWRRPNSMSIASQLQPTSERLKVDSANQSRTLSKL